MTSLDAEGFVGTYVMTDNCQKEKLYEKLFTYFNKLEKTEQKYEFIKKVSKLFDVDYNKIETERYLSLLNMSEIKKLSAKGVDIQLHTHRHRMPFEQKDGIQKEIHDNRTCLISCVDNELEHFCYPSGVYNQDCEQILKAMGITTATTCNNGFVSSKSNFYYLPRFLDGESVPQIVFEAELCGMSEILRRIRNFIKCLKSLSFKDVEKSTA